MRHHKVLAKNFLLSTVTMLMLALGSSQLQAQFSTPTPPYIAPPVVPTVFDGLDWLTDRGGFLFDGMPLSATAYGNFNVDPQRQGRNNVGPYATPTPALDAHRGINNWNFPRSVDTNGPGFTCIVDNPYFNNNVMAAGVGVWNKSFPGIFSDSSQPIDALTDWLGKGFTIPPPANRATNGFSFTFSPSDPPGPVNPPSDAIGDYGYGLAVHNDFIVNRGNNPSGPATAAELAGMPNVDPAVYKAVQNVLIGEYNTRLNITGNPIAQWTLGTKLNYNYDVTNATLYPGFGAVIDPLNPNQPPTEYISPVPYDGYPLLAPTPATAPNLRTVKYNVDIYSPGSGTILPDTLVHPNVQRAFVRVSWKKTVFQPGLVPPPPDNINPGTPDGQGGYVAGAGGVNDPANSRIYMVDLSQPGWIHIGAPNATPASFPNGGGVDQIVVTLYSVTPDDPNDSTLYSTTALVTADACRFTETIAPALPVVGAPVPPPNNLGPLNDPINPNITFVGANGRFLGPVAGTNKFTQDGSTLWYCVREEVIPNQVRVATDPTLPINTTTNLSIIDPASTSTAPVFYCLTNERDLIPATVANPVAVETTTKSKVVWRYVGFPDGGSATSFTSPVVANVRGRDGKYHVIVYFCGSSDTELNGQVGRIYALDALGDTRTDPTVRTTVTTAYWTYPSLRPIEKEEIPAPTGIEAGTNTFPNQYHDPNFTHGFAPGPNPPADPENLYSINDPAHYNNNWVQGFWWNADQQLFGSGSKQYYDGDVITDPSRAGSYIVKTDTQITMGGIVGAPVVLNDPGNPTGPMLLVVPSIDGRMYAFDAGGRGDFNTTKTLPAPAVDPTNPTLPPGTVSTLGVNYTIPGTTQRLWAWPHWGADAFHQIYDMAGSVTNASTANTFQDEASKGAMPFSPSYDSTFGQDDPRNVLVVSAGSNGQDGLPGTGHVYGIIPQHDGPVTIGTNNIPTWTVSVTGGLFTGTTDRRYWAYPHEGTGVNDPSDTPLLDIPSVPTIYPAAAGDARNIYFTSGGRVYSLNLPNKLPAGGHYDTAINWVFPHTPINYLPNQDPNDTTTAAFPQGFAPKGLCVVPAAVSHVPDPTTGQPVDAVYALLTDGTMLSLEAYPIGASAFQTIQMGQSATPGTFTESAPTLVELAVGVALGGSGQLNNGTITLPTSVPALVYADDNGDIYGIQLQPNTYTSGANSTTLMPVIYHQSFGGGAPITTPPALAASTRILPVNTLPPLDPNGHVLNAQPYYGGYFVVGDSYGQLHAFALGTFANGYGGSSPNEPITDYSTGSGAGRVSIDIREFDVFSANDYNNMAPLTAGLAAAKTPARKQDGTTYPTTATPLAANVGPAGNPYGIGVDQGGNLYLAASGVYHAQAENSGAVAEFGVNAPIITVTFRVSQLGMADEIYTVTATPLSLNPNNTGAGINDRWPDDLAIPAASKDLLQIWGIDNNNPSATPNPFGDGSAPQQLTGRPQNVYPWVAKQLVRIIPKNVNGTTTFSPGSGTTVTVTAVIVQNIRTVSSNRTNIARAAAEPATLGYQNAAGSSQSMLGPDPNNPYNSTVPQKELFVTNPLGLTVRSYQNLNDMTGTGPLVNPNMVGWAGPIDSPFLPGSGVANVNELVGNGAFVGLNIPLRAAQAGNTRTLNGYIKPVFAPFGLAADNSTATYLASNGGTRIPAIFVMDRSNLTAATGQPVKVRASVSPLSWNGTVASILNPLPFDQLPDPSRASVDYPALNSGTTSVSVNGIDATKTVATLKAPTNTTTDPAKRQPQPTPVNLSAQIAKYTPANVNRGQIPYNYRGTTINLGGTFVDMAGYEHGYSTTIGSTKHGSTDTNPIVGPLDTASGLPINQVNGNNLAAASPSGGYVGNVTITVVPPGATATRTPTSGIQNFFRPSASGPTYRIFQTGLSVAPSFRMRVLETTLDMGKVPHGTGYTDLVGGNYLYRYPFAPTATGAYNGANAGGTTLYSPWDSDGQFSNLSPLAATIPQLGRYFLPFTLINDGNLNLVRPRVTKLVGSHGADTGKTPNLSDVINNASLSINPGFGIANSLRLNSDQVNNLLSPPLFASPFGQQAASGGNPGFLGNIGIVSSFDHDSYAQGLISEVSLYPLTNPAVDGGTNLSNPTALQNLTDLYNAGLYAPDLYAKGANVAATKWGVGVQGRPSIHKPRPGDSNGVIATSPDQPHDYQFAVQNNNPTQTGFYQQQQSQGLFSRPAMSIAVPLGTPVGTYSATVYPYEDGLPLQWLEWLAISDPKNSGTVALGNDDDILNTNSAGQPVEPYANPAPILKLTVQENRLTNGNTTGSMPQIDTRNINTGGYDPLSYNLQPAALMIPDTSPNLRNSIWLYWTTNRVLPGSKFGTTLNGSTFPNPNAPINIAYSSLNTPYANLNGYIRGDAGFTGQLFTAAGIALPQWWGLSGNTAPFALLPGYTDKDTPDKTALLFNNNAINPATARYASPAVTLATRFDTTTGTYPVDAEAYEVHQGSVELLRQGNNSTPLAFQQTLTRTFYSSLNGQTPGAPDYAAAGSVDGMFAFDNDPALPKLSPHPLLVKIQTGAANVGYKFLYVFWHSGVQGRSALYYNVNVQTKGLNQGFDATTPAAGNTPGTGFALLGDAKLDTPAALSWQSDPYPVYRHVYDPTTNGLVDAIDVMYTGVLKNRQTVEILISRYRIVETAQPANGSQPALQVGQLTPIPFPTVHQDLLSRVPGTNTWAARDAGWFLPPDSQNADTAANRFMRISLMPANNNNSYPINALENNLGTQRGKVDPATGQVYFNAVAIDPATNKIAVDAANRPIFGGGQIVVDPKAGTVSFPNIPPKNTDTVLASYTPYLIRVNTARDDFNIDRDTSDLPGAPFAYGNGQFTSLLAKFRPNVAASGQNYAPTYVMDRAPNSRATLQSPQVIFNTNNVPYFTFNKNGQLNSTPAPTPIDRKWILYRKSDVDNKIKTVYMKTQRLMARLPRPVALSAVNGTNTSPLAAQAISNLTVQRFDPASNSFVPLRNVYEVDWVRGRVYFQEEDEGDVVQISYTFYDPISNKTGQSGNLYYRVDWGDEINSTFSPYDTNGKWIGYDSTQEVQMPTNSTVNEGAVTAFKDSYIDKLWIFWSSTRAGAAINGQSVGTTDLYYETLAPQFYPSASNQY